MKIIICIIILLSSVGCKVYRHTTTLKLNPIDFTGKQSHYWDPSDTITVYKLPGKAVIFQRVPDQYPKWPAYIKNVPVGHFLISYPNIFQQIVTKEVTLTPTRRNTINLYYDSLQIYPVNTLAQLENNDSIMIHWTSHGCFHYTCGEISIIKVDDGFIAKLYSGFSWIAAKYNPSHTLNNRVLIKTVLIPGHQIPEYTRFENELPFTIWPASTTEDYYCIESKYDTIRHTDAGANWYGFRRLREALFGKRIINQQ